MKIEMKDSTLFSLERDLRSQLERVVVEARDQAEAGASAAIEHLGVGNTTPYAHLSEEERDLRRRLRAHGRSLGDERQAKGEQETLRLMEEVAYQHWHRMLFARFLAENDLLMYPDPDEPVAVTLEECEELAAGQGAKNGWELAARYAARMLPQIFRPDSPVFELELPPEYQQTLEQLVTDLPKEVFTALDSLGWVYQFWQSKKKDEVNASGVKIGARELPAVTQLFTEPYMVSFLLENSLGAWWAARRLTEEDLKAAESEEELRQKASLPSMPIEYLRFVKEEDRWTPAAGTFDGWPEHLGELKTLDPCCGSGHFLVAALGMLVPMRMEREGLSAREAVNAVLTQNLHGLDIDKRVTEIAAFALAFAAWRYPGAGGYRVLPELSVACSGLAISTKKEEWLALAGEDTNLRIALDELYEQFKDATVLGSLIDPETSLGKESLFKLKREEVGPLLMKALSGEKDDDKKEMAIVAHGLSKTSELLTDKYQLIGTNVPFLTGIKYADGLKMFIEKYLYKGKANLATAMALRLQTLLSNEGVASYVAPQSWLFLKGYSEFREYLLIQCNIRVVARLGEQGFQSTQAKGEQVCLNIVAKKVSQTAQTFYGLDASEGSTVEETERLIFEQGFREISLQEQMERPQHAISFSETASFRVLGEYSTALRGCGTGDAPRFVRQYWEVNHFYHIWATHHTTAKGLCLFDGMSEIILWEEEKGALSEFAESVRHLNHAAQNWRRGKPNWGRKGVVVSQMGLFPSSLYSGAIYDPNCCAIVPENDVLVPALWSFCISREFPEAVKAINQNRKVEVRTFLSIPFDLDYWTKVAEDKYPNGLPKPFSDNPTQWIYHGHPCGSVIWDEEEKWTGQSPLRTDNTVLQVAVARLLGYRWPAELEENMELAEEQREWVERSKSLLPFADEDGIVCIPPVRGETSASDRLLNLLAAAYGEAWRNNTLTELLRQADHTGKTLESWLRDKFFTQHFKLFHHRPFIWHIWDGLHDGFAVLVNYHKLDRKLLETLIYTYLGDWISRQKQDIQKGVDGAQDKLAAAEALKKNLELILEGEEPYDIFVRWKQIEEQPIGWDPDLNDGVRLNIRPFMSVPDVGKKGAGVLRDKPNIHWKKDRGKDVKSAPWYPLFQGDRINDHHLSLAEKRAARKVTT